VTDVPECLACGACCFGDTPRYLRLCGDDYERLGDLAEELTQWIGNRVYMRIEHGHCAALHVDVGNRDLRCTVYEQRPRTCRELDRGSPECLGERAVKVKRPLVALDRLTKLDDET
jgi:Fe-S-cluster containining protein